MLFGGSLTCLGGLPRHHRGSWDGDYDTLFGHHHPVDLMPGGALAGRSGHRRVEVNSVHQQGVDRLGYGLVVEARDAEDGLIEAFRAPAAARTCWRFSGIRNGISRPAASRAASSPCWASRYAVTPDHPFPAAPSIVATTVRTVR